MLSNNIYACLSGRNNHRKFYKVKIVDVSLETNLSILQSVKRSQYQSIIWKTTKEPTLTIQLLESKKDGKDHETIQSSTITDPRYHMGK